MVCLTIFGWSSRVWLACCSARNSFLGVTMLGNRACRVNGFMNHFADLEICRVFSVKVFPMLQALHFAVIQAADVVRSMFFETTSAEGPCTIDASKEMIRTTWLVCFPFSHIIYISVDRKINRLSGSRAVEFSQQTLRE